MSDICTWDTSSDDGVGVAAMKVTSAPELDKMDTMDELGGKWTTDITAVVKLSCSLDGTSVDSESIVVMVVPSEAIVAAVSDRVTAV